MLDEIHVIATLETGGAERLLVEIAKDGVSAGRSVVVVTLKGDTAFGDALRESGIRVHDFGSSRGGLMGTSLSLVRAVAFLRSTSGAAAVGWMYHGALLAALATPQARTRLASFHHRDPADSGVKWTTKAVVAALGRFGRRFDGAVYVSAESRDAHASAGLRIPSTVIPVGVDLSRFAIAEASERASAREALGLGADVEVILHLARVHPDKGQETLLAAFARVRTERPDAVLLLAGKGWSTDNPAVAEWLAAYGSDRIVLLGEMADPGPALTAADVFCLSSNTEALPVSLIEAMASGLVPVVTDVGACRSAVEEEGHVAPPRDPDALAQAVAKALSRLQSDVELPSRVRANVVARFDSRVMCEAYRRILQEA